MAQLPPDVKSLCGRLAAEELRAAAWRRGAELRKIYRARVEAGEDAAKLAAELRQAIRQAAGQTV